MSQEAFPADKKKSHPSCNESVGQMADVMGGGQWWSSGKDESRVLPSCLLSPGLGAPPACSASAGEGPGAPSYSSEVHQFRIPNYHLTRDVFSSPGVTVAAIVS